ncbi:MAG: PDZ domain-containing protein [Oscillospiraceae bacterium]|nr:PDZ domain-containing protein [Oscillospiraceae bacterium]
MKRGFKITALLLALCMMLSCFAFAEEVDYGEKLDEAVKIYRENGLYADEETDYVREALIEMFEEDPELFYELVNRIYSREDRYSYYMTPEEYETSFSLENTMVGIGIVISTSDDGYPLVQQVSKGPAMTAGILAGDKICEVDGNSVAGYLPAELGTLIRGEEGTTVNIKVIRGEEKLDFTIKRAKITVSEVTSYNVTDEIGYIKLDHFSGIDAFIDFMVAYDGFEESGVNTIILDLRDNPGGQLDCLINLMDNIIPEKEVPYLMTWQSKPLRVNTFYSEGFGWEFNKFVILVNSNTASASEIMTGALQDLGYAVVVGEQTHGKGMGQRHIVTKDGDEAVVTGLELKLPVSGRYDGVGITPDYEVKMKVTPYKLPYLTPLKSKYDASKIKTENVKALEERLSCLGYFYATPDDEWDEKTLRAVNLFCKENGLPMSNSMCKWDVIVKIDEAAKNLEHKYVVEDAPMEKAIELAKEYAASGKKAERVDGDLIDFSSGR